MEGRSDKSRSRKWLVTVWAMAVGTVTVLFLCACALMGRSVPDGLVGLASLLFSTGIAYIGGNVFQKQIFHKDDRVREQ